MSPVHARIKRPTPSPKITPGDKGCGDVIEYTLSEPERLELIEKYGPPLRPWRRKA